MSRYYNDYTDYLMSRGNRNISTDNYIGIIGVLVKEVQELQNQLADVLHLFPFQTPNIYKID